MIISIFQGQPMPRVAAAVALLAFGAGLGGCASMGDTVSTAFADPAKYEFYDCKQLEKERSVLATRAAEQQGLMAKAETGVAGPVVAELAYRNEAIAIEGQRKFAEEAWRKNKCHPSPPAADAAAPATPVANAKGGKPIVSRARAAQPAQDSQPVRGAPPASRSGSAVY